MGNKSYTFKVGWVYKEDTNRSTPNWTEVKTTSVGRVLSKIVRDLNTEEDGTVLDKTHDEFTKNSDIMIVDCRNITRGWPA